MDELKVSRLDLYEPEQTRLSGRGSFGEHATFGTRDGAAFELPFVRVSELDDAGRIQRVDLYDLNQFEQPGARFRKLCGAREADPRRAVARFRSMPGEPVTHR